jgi:hypothetical protein
MHSTRTPNSRFQPLDPILGLLRENPQVVLGCNRTVRHTQVGWWILAAVIAVPIVLAVRTALAGDSPTVATRQGETST